MISQTTEYALRAVVFLASRPDRTAISAQDISEATKVPVGYLQKILRSLAKEKILTAQRGSGGGFALAKVATSIRVLDVLQATDSSLQRIERCPLGIEGHMKLCSLHHMLDREIARVEQTFATTSIADLLTESRGTLPLCGSGSERPVELGVKAGSKPNPSADQDNSQ